MTGVMQKAAIWVFSAAAPLATISRTSKGTRERVPFGKSLALVSALRKI
jgi:hypothetical protein